MPTSQRGSHVRFTHADGRSTVVPHHARDDLDRWLLLKVVKAAGIDAGSFFGGP